MNKIERVRAALAGKPVDRVPASFWFHFTKDKARGAASVKAHLDYYRASGVDFLKVMNEHPYQANVTITSPSDWRKVRPAPLSAPFYQAQLDEVKRIVDQVAGECLVIVTIFGPFSSGNHASNDAVTAHVKTDAAAAAQGLLAIGESLGAFGAACRAAKKSASPRTSSCAASSRPTWPRSTVSRPTASSTCCTSARITFASRSTPTIPATLSTGRRPSTT
jgi:uroporphyrinogen decarboxylase